MADVPGEMPPALVQFLLGGQTCVVATVDGQGVPITTLMTWVVARNEKELSMAIDTRGRSLKNVRANGQVAVEVLGDDLCYGLRGVATVEKELMTSTPFPSALVTLRLEEVRDHSAPGIRFVGPTYSFHPGKEHRAGVEDAVFRELKGTAPTI